MNKEIEEIEQRLKLLHAECNPKAREEDINYTIDYITNLQQENERLNNLLEYNMQTLVNTDKLYENYKSRCEKAIEYIDKQKKKMYKSRNKIAMFILMKLENILQNGSEEK